MGDDSSVVQAARVSYGQGAKTPEEDRNLIRYLMRNKHTSPFEMVEFKFHIKAPIFVFRQWQRHRAACLAEGTVIYFDLPGGIKRRGRQRYNLTIEELYRKIHKDDFSKNRIQNMMLRHLNEDNMRLQHTHVVDVFKNGKKNVFKITLCDDRFIEATEDHLFLFSDGWSTIKEKCNVFLNKEGHAVIDNKDFYLYTNGIVEQVPRLYKDKNWLYDKYHVLKLSITEIAGLVNVSYHTIRKWLKIYGLQRAKPFEKGHSPWNLGKTYRTYKPISEELKQKIREARSGEKSNFWKGGVTKERSSIGRWTTQIAHKIHEKNGFTCQLCHEKSSYLHCHHIIPVWYDPTKGVDENNLTTLCVECHKKVNLNELDFISLLTGEPFIGPRKQRPLPPKIPPNKLEFAKLVKIKSIEFVGEKETYDIEVEGPHHNFIANGFVTHNSINECSLRYTEAKDEYYVPEINQVCYQSKDNKQGRSVPFEDEEASFFQTQFQLESNVAFSRYNIKLNRGMAKELARINLPLSTYSEMYWKMDLHNLFHFLKLRLHPHAQYEIRVYAQAILDIIKPIVPISCEAFEDYILNAQSLSGKELEVLGELLKDPFIAEMLTTLIEQSELGSREKKELKNKLF
jgi:thymidylate synthase (FAD)